MRRIGIIENEMNARKFGDYLLTLGYENRVDDFDSGWAVWIEDEDKIEAACVEIWAFMKDPDNPKFSGVEESASKIRKKAWREEKRWRGMQKDLRATFHQMAGMPPKVTMAMIIISLAVALLTKLGQDKAGPVMALFSIATYVFDGFSIRWEGLSQLASGQIWRLFTPMFIHFGMIHLLFNMLWLHDLGRLVEGRKGHKFFILLVLLIAGFSNLAQYFTSGPGFGGMSGVVYGLLGYVWMKMKFQPEEGLFISSTILWFMMGWLVLCFTGALGAVANTVHTVGLVVGLIFGYFPTARQKWRRARRG